MILTTWLILFSVSILFLLAGKYTETPPLMIGGYTILFITGVLLMFGNIEYNITTEETYIYGTNYTGYHYDDYGGPVSPSVNDLNIFHKNITKIYEPIADEEVLTGTGIQIKHTAGFIIAILSILGFINVMTNLGRFKPKNKEAIYNED